MSTGGATWAAAGTLDIGGSNTFTRTDGFVGDASFYPCYWPSFWTYTPTSPVTLSLDAVGTEGTSPDTVMAVYSGSSPGTLLISNDDSIGLISALEVNLNAGETVHIVLGSYADDGSTITVFHLNASTTPYVPPLVDDFPVNVDYFGAKTPIAWNGADRHVFESITNNARHYGIPTIEHEAPGYLGGFGYTPTTTSNSPYVENTGFVYPDIAVLPVYVDAEPTDKYQLSTVRFVDSGVTVTRLVEVDRIAFPTQDFHLSSFIRSWLVFPDNPTILCYGNTGPGVPVVEAWEITIASDGTFGSWTSLGTVSYPDPGSIPGGGAHYAADISAPLVFSDRLAIQQNTKILYDRLNPTLFQDAYTWSPNSGGFQVGDTYFGDARAAPGQLGVVERNEINTAYWVSVGAISADGSVRTWETWATPAGTVAAWAGFTKNAKVVVYVQDSTGATRAFYDVLGPDFVEFTNPAIVEVATEWGNLQIVPTAPAAGTPDVTGSYDSWLTTAADTAYAPMILEMFGGSTTPESDPVYPCDQRIVEVLANATFLGAPNGQYGDGVIYATEAP